jgi:hypothetical protein
VSDDICVADVRDWADGWVEVGELIGARFARSEPRASVVEYLRGLLSEEDRKNSWTLSERAGHRVPDRMQRLLSTADWDPDALRAGRGRDRFSEEGSAVRRGRPASTRGPQVGWKTARSVCS